MGTGRRGVISGAPSLWRSSLSRPNTGPSTMEKLSRSCATCHTSSNRGSAHASYCSSRYTGPSARSSRYSGNGSLIASTENGSYSTMRTECNRMSFRESGDDGFCTNVRFRATTSTCRGASDSALGPLGGRRRERHVELHHRRVVCRRVGCPRGPRGLPGASDRHVRRPGQPVSGPTWWGATGRAGCRLHGMFIHGFSRRTSTR